jgi:hypothetical protein
VDHSDVQKIPHSFWEGGCELAHVLSRLHAAKSRIMDGGPDDVGERNTFIHGQT